MQTMLHGVRRIDMVDDSGRPINGFSCFISYPEEGVQGVMTSKIFVSDSLAAANAWSPEVGKLLNVEFTPRGKVGALSTVREK